MKKNFTPEKIKKGEVHYSLEDFLNDLWDEVKTNLHQKDFGRLSEEERKNDLREATKKVFYFVYEICYLAAIKKVYLDIILKKSDESERKHIKNTIKENRDNINLLRAILLRRITSGLNKGLSRRQATRAAMEYSKDVIYKWDR
jgi:hypothetical protein